MNCKTLVANSLHRFFQERIKNEHDIVYTVLQKDCNFRDILDDLLEKYEPTELKQTRSHCFVYGIFAFHLDLDVDIGKIPVSHSVISDIHTLRKTGVLTDNLLRFHRYHSVDTILFSFLKRVNALRTFSMHGTEFEADNEMQKEVIRQGFVEYRRAQMQALSDGSIFQNRYAFRSYGNWLVHSRNLEILSMVSPYQHLFADYAEDYAEMYLALRNASQDPSMFQCLYTKKIRMTVSVDFWNCRRYIDNHDGGIPYALIESKASEALTWYISTRRNTDSFYSRSFLGIISMYYEIAVNMHGYGDPLVNELMKLMCEERMNQYKEELIRVTWHPQRVRWWMDHEEYQELFQLEK